METDEQKVNDKNRDGTVKDAAQLHVEQVLYREGVFLGQSNDRQKAENKKRGESRDRIKGAGLVPSAIAMSAKLVKNMSPKDRKQWIEDFLIGIDVLSKNQAEFWPEETMKQQKKEAREKAADEEAARVAAENAATDPDKKPKSDPKRGGAGGVNGRGKAKDKGAVAPAGETPPTPPEVPGDGTGENDGPREGESTDDLIKRQAQEMNAAVEQRDGAKVLDGHFPKNGSPRKSQSAQAAEILEKNGLNKPLH